MIDHTTVERIFDATNIIDVVQDFVTLKKRGVNYLGLCPFHNEKTPSFTVSPSKGIYKCFGCGKSGNAVNFVIEHEHLSYYESLKYLAKKYNISIIEKESSPEELQQKNERESMLIINSYATKYFHETLLHHSEGIAVGLSYFKERDFLQTTIDKFELGYSLSERKSFSEEALKNGYKLEYLTKTGLTIAKEDGYYFDRFSGRVMFPIHSLAGKVIGFGGRILKTDKSSAKYLNSPESEIYHKSNVLYGLYQAKRAIEKEKKCLLVEGYTDVLSLHQNGIENVVASSGTSLTVEQIRLIKRFTPNVTILYDGDAAGIKASLRGVDLILEEGLQVKIVLLPNGEDPDSYARKLSSSEFTDYIVSNETDFIVFKSKLLLTEADTDPLKRASLITDIVKSIAVIPESITRSVYIKECANLLNIEEAMLYSEVSRLRRKKAEQQYKQAVKEKETIEAQNTLNPFTSKVNDTEYVEKEILRLLIQYANIELFTYEPEPHQVESVTVASFIFREILGDELILENPVYQQIFEEIQHQINNGLTVEEKYFINHPDRKVNQCVSQLLAPGNQLSKIWSKNDNYIETEDMVLKVMVPEVIHNFKEKKIRSMYIENQLELKEAQEKNEFDRIEEIMFKQMNLNTLKMLLSKKLNWTIT